MTESGAIISRQEKFKFPLGEQEPHLFWALVMLILLHYLNHLGNHIHGNVQQLNSFDPKKQRSQLR